MLTYQEINSNYDIELRFEELKDSRNGVPVKFFFKQTIVRQVINQKTGKKINIYSKPKIQPNLRKKANQDSSVISPNIIEDQLDFNDVTSEAKPIKNKYSIFSTLKIYFIKKVSYKIKTFFVYLEEFPK